MVVLSKYIIAFIMAFMVNSKSSYEPIFNDLSAVLTLSNTIDNSKENAFQILNNKCNICHIKRNRRRVFTEDNMNSWSNDVYKQVFIKKRMPKGKKIKLTSKEYQELLTWISSTKDNNNGNKI